MRCCSVGERSPVHGRRRASPQSPRTGAFPARRVPRSVHREKVIGARPASAPDVRAPPPLRPGGPPEPRLGLGALEPLDFDHPWRARRDPSRRARRCASPQHSASSRTTASVGAPSAGRVAPRSSSSVVHAPRDALAARARVHGGPNAVRSHAHGHIHQRLHDEIAHHDPQDDHGDERLRGRSLRTGGRMIRRIGAHTASAHVEELDDRVRRIGPHPRQQRVERTVPRKAPARASRSSTRRRAAGSRSRTSFAPRSLRCGARAGTAPCPRAPVCCPPSTPPRIVAHPHRQLWRELPSARSAASRRGSAQPHEPGPRLVGSVDRAPIAINPSIASPPSGSSRSSSATVRSGATPDFVASPLTFTWTSAATRRPRSDRELRHAARQFEPSPPCGRGRTVERTRALVALQVADQVPACGRAPRRLDHRARLLHTVLADVPRVRTPIACRTCSTGTVFRHTHKGDGVRGPTRPLVRPPRCGWRISSSRP